MVDNVNPTSQFHPYQPQDATPHAERTSQGLGGLGGVLGKLGIDQSKIDALGGNLRNIDLRGQLERARGMARKNPSLVVGGLAALAIGAGLLRRRGTAR